MLRLFRSKRGSEGEKTRQAVRKTRETWFGRIAGLLGSSRLDESVWEELEEILIGADVGVETSLGMVQRLRERARTESLKESQAVLNALKEEVVSILEGGSGHSLQDEAGGVASPLVVLMVGVNGVGKTTSIAKLAYYFREQGKRVVLAAGDTFRAAAVEQLQVLGQRVGAEVIAHREGADPGAVVYDSYEACKARGADVLIIDTAGRLHTKTNLMDELQKVRRVLSRLDHYAPHETILALDANTGQNGLAQAKQFHASIGCTGIFLAKLDGTARGGIVLAIARELGLPILFVGTGEQLEDMAPFDAREFAEALLAPVS